MPRLNKFYIPKGWVYHVDTRQFKPLPSVPTHELIYTHHKCYLVGPQEIAKEAKLELGRRLPHTKDAQLVSEIYSILFGGHDD